MALIEVLRIASTEPRPDRRGKKTLDLTIDLESGLQRSRDLIAAESVSSGATVQRRLRLLQRSRDLIAAERSVHANEVSFLDAASTEPRPDRRGKGRYSNQLKLLRKPNQLRAPCLRSPSWSGISDEHRCKHLILLTHLTASGGGVERSISVLDPRRRILCGFHTAGNTRS